MSYQWTLYQELGLESLKSLWRYRKLCLFFKLKENEHPPYLFDINRKVLSTQIIRDRNNVPLINFEYKYFQNYFFPSTVTEWKKLGNQCR